MTNWKRSLVGVLEGQNAAHFSKWVFGFVEQARAA